MTMLDIVVAGYVIELNEWSSYNNREPAKMILGLLSLKIISEIDNHCAQYFMKFIVKPTEMGVEILMHKGYS